MPGVEGQDPASFGGANGTWDSVYQAPGLLMQKPAPRPLPSALAPFPLSQGEVAIDKGVSGWSLPRRADAFWFPPPVSTSVVSQGLG